MRPRVCAAASGAREISDAAASVVRFTSLTILSNPSLNRYALTFMKISTPPSRKKITIRSEGTTPMKMYDRMSFRRTRQSSRSFISTNNRQTK
jgi:hypothetical protein